MCTKPRFKAIYNQYTSFPPYLQYIFISFKSSLFSRNVHFCIIETELNSSSVFFRLSRSSSMASKQETDSDTQDISVISHIINTKRTEKKVMVNSGSQSVSSTPGQDSLDNGDAAGDASSSPPPRQILNRSTTRSSSSSFSESLDPALDPSCLPPPDPWLESGNGSNNSVPQSGGGGTLCRRDGHWFLKLLQAETGRMEGWCQQMEQETKDNQLSEEGKAGRGLPISSWKNVLLHHCCFSRMNVYELNKAQTCAGCPSVASSASVQRVWCRLTSAVSVFCLQPYTHCIRHTQHGGDEAVIPGVAAHQQACNPRITQIYSGTD